jgi:hypothetical protein
MNLDWLDLVERVLSPLIGASSGLIADLVSNSKSLMVGRAELASILSVAQTRLTDMEREWQQRDLEEDARVATEQASKANEPTKP